MRIFRGFVRLCVVAGCLVLLASYLGAVHPLGDSLAVFRVWIALALALVACLALVLRLKKLGGLSLAFSAFAGSAIALAMGVGAGAAPDGPVITVYTKNLGAGRIDWSAFQRDVAATGADIVLLQEMTASDIDAMAERLPDLPHRHVCQFSGWSGMAVVSRWPLSDGVCTRHRGLAGATVDAPGGTVWAASVHQIWPYPHRQAGRLPDLLDQLNPDVPRRIVAGDFNMVPWGHSVRQIMARSGTERINPAITTIEVRGIGLPIDHVLSNGQGPTERRPRLGSDHYGLVARLGWP